MASFYFVQLTIMCLTTGSQNKYVGRTIRTFLVANMISAAIKPMKTSTTNTRYCKRIIDKHLNTSSLNTDWVYGYDLNNGKNAMRCHHLNTPHMGKWNYLYQLFSTVGVHSFVRLEAKYSTIVI